MDVLIVGSGGREHAIARSVRKSSQVEKIYCAPGNAGIQEIAECVEINPMELEKLADFAEKKKIGLTIVGMDAPLSMGIVDLFEERGLRAFGPRKKAAMIESSKSFSKDLMKKYQIPTAAYETFDDAEQAISYLKDSKYPLVLKADGLALGKGVLICNTREEALEGIKDLMIDKVFGAAGSRVVVEEFLTGREVSVLCYCDGTHILPMTSAQDHKRAKDGDKGLNTGGMGTFSPSPFYTDEVKTFCEEKVFKTSMKAMKAEGRDFVGILFVGIILTPEGPKVLEYNARFGDPEAQVILPRMKTDIVEIMEACIDGNLDEISLEFEDNAAVCIVLASNGYPEAYETGKEIKGLETFSGKENYYAFHAGTKKNGDKILTNGGRVLGITAKGTTLKEARENAYKAAQWVQFENKYMRNDIGKAIDQWKKD
ncbi:MAG: phosphoribosylamine--glycine ligase [Acetivibrio sp.]